MADSCAAIARELAALRAEVAALKKVDEEAIAERGAKKAQQRLSPQIAAVGVVAGGAMGLARTAIARILAFLASLASLQAIVTGILVTIAVIAYLVAAVEMLKGGQAALEARLNGAYRQIDDVRQTATKALGAAIDAGMRADKAQREVDLVEVEVRVLTIRLEVAEADIKILEKVNKQQDAEIAKANAEIKRLGGELNKANAIIKSLQAENARQDAQIKDLYAGLRAIHADLLKRLSMVFEALIGAINTLRQELYSELEIRDYRISEANNRANKAINEANAATNRANRAAAEANAATNRANQAIAEANSTAQQLPPVASTANNANTQSAEAIRIVKDGVRTIYNPKVYEPTITNAVTRTVQAIVPVSIADAKAETKRQVDAVKNSIQSQYQAGQQQIQDLRDRVIRLAPTGVGSPAITQPRINEMVANSPAIKDLQRTAQGTQAQVAPLAQAVTGAIPRINDIERELANNDVANQNIERKLDALIPAVTAIPAATGALIIPRLLTPDKAGEVVRTNVCQVARPGGCLGNPLQGLLRGQGGLLDALNTGANVGQTALLFKIDQTTSRIDTKIGSTSIAGGLSGGIKRFMQSQIVDRVLNLVTAAAAFHNVMMLSNSIQSTFFSMLDNLFTIPQLIIDPDGASIDTRETVTKFLDSYFAKLFGVSEWTAIKAQWKAFSTIYSSAAQGFENLRQIHNDSQELLNMARNYTAQLGNALVDEGIISEDNWEYKDPNKKIKSKGINRLDQIGRGLAAVDDSLQAIETVTATLLNITQSANEIKENVDAINKGIDDANKAAIARRAAEGEGIDLPNFSLDDLF